MAFNSRALSLLASAGIGGMYYQAQMSHIHVSNGLVSFHRRFIFKFIGQPDSTDIKILLLLKSIYFAEW